MSLAEIGNALFSNTDSTVSRAPVHRFPSCAKANRRSLAIGTMCLLLQMIIIYATGETPGRENIRRVEWFDAIALSRPPLRKRRVGGASVWFYADRREWPGVASTVRPRASSRIRKHAAQVDGSSSKQIFPG